VLEKQSYSPTSMKYALAAACICEVIEGGGDFTRQYVARIGIEFLELVGQVFLLNTTGKWTRRFSPEELHVGELALRLIPKSDEGTIPFLATLRDELSSVSDRGSRSALREYFLLVSDELTEETAVLE